MYPYASSAHSGYSMSLGCKREGKGNQAPHGFLSPLTTRGRSTAGSMAPCTGTALHLAAASSAGTSLEANLKHITVTLATWDAVWEVYVDPKWAQQWLRLYGAQDRTLEQFFKKLEEDMAEVSIERHGRTKQLVVFFGAAGIGTRGGWGAGAVLRACCKVVCRPRGTDQRRGRVVLVDEHRTTRVSSAVNGQQPLAPRKPPQAPRSSQEASQAAASEPGPSTPLPAKRSKRTKAELAAEPNKAQGKAAKAKPAPQPGRWLDRDCNAALNMQRIGESKWRPLELCWWPEQGALPAKGKEYPGLGYKRVRDKPPKAQQQQPAVAQQQQQERQRQQQQQHPTRSGRVGHQVEAKPAPQPGRWLDRDCNAALNMQRIGESRWRPLKLCYWKEQGALPAKGKEYPGLGYKRLTTLPSPPLLHLAQCHHPRPPHEVPP
ncbi:hypothetical protein QJQ45_028619 [Haematococcus lacustris]|nr:hypothetical protein QJQ45_028619 [Haematococcus lacustris]